jgi:hypothetical protein
LFRAKSKLKRERSGGTYSGCLNQHCWPRSVDR